MDVSSYKAMDVMKPHVVEWALNICLVFRPSMHMPEFIHLEGCVRFLLQSNKPSALLYLALRPRATGLF